MARKSAPKKKINTDAWLNTYADMVTLVLCLFVLLFSVSSVDSEKWEIVVRALNPDALANAVAAGGESTGESTRGTVIEPGDVGDINDLFMALEEYVEANNLETDIEVMQGDGFTFIVFRNNIFFDGDRSYLKPEGKKVLDHLCASLEGVTDDIAQLRVWGHTNQADPNKPNKPHSDWTLSSLRAAEVVAYIDDKGIITRQKLKSEGFGQTFPIAGFVEETDRQKNRRVEILIAENSAVNIALEEVYAQIGRESATFE